MIIGGEGICIVSCVTAISFRKRQNVERKKLLIMAFFPPNTTVELATKRIPAMWGGSEMAPMQVLQLSAFATGHCSLWLYTIDCSAMHAAMRLRGLGKASQCCIILCTPHVAGLLLLV